MPAQFPIVKPQPEPAPFHPKDALRAATEGALLGGGAGFFAAAIQNSLAKTHVGPWGVFTRHGGTIGTLTVVPTVYCFSEVAIANLRERDDTWNTTIAAFLGGAFIGLRTGRLPQIFGQGAAASLLLTTFRFTGDQLGGTQNDHTASEFDRKEYMRLNKRRPIEEVIGNIGEGRGIEPPGYKERRKERLEKRLGVEIKPVTAEVVE